MSNDRILTRQQFIEALDRQLAKERAETIRRFDRGAEIYGEEVDLTERDWDEEAFEEHLDMRVYAMFGQIKDERGL